MALGAGKYDDLCTYVREKAMARGAIIIVIGGDKGMGFSCQGDLETLARIPDLLEELARQIRADMMRG